MAKKSPPKPSPARRIPLGAIAAALGVAVVGAGLYRYGPSMLPKGATPTEYRGQGPSGSEYVSSAVCAECHQEQHEDWLKSHHKLAMEPASDETILGDFNDAEFTYFDETYRFFRRDGRFFVNAPGPDGKAADFEIQYAFGATPLQQYLIEFPGGRLQCLTVAWDVPGRRWYHLYPNEKIPAGDALHWTGRYQVWNHMCASCHTTDLRKNYDAPSDTYATTWAELSVTCQACHGPGGNHVEWARALPPGTRPEPGDYALDVAFSGLDADIEIQTCAPCHSRRHPVSPNQPAGKTYYDNFMVETLRDGLYFADGQILEEVYVYASFLQSKMYSKGVRCSDCHNIHSLQLHSPGNGVCTRCHQTSPPEEFESLKAGEYDTPEHHHHQLGSTGAQCVNCHAPERTYMGVDPRRDHSFRIPRPELTTKIEAPNACTGCHEHGEESPEWAANAIAKWYGSDRDQAPHWGEALAAGRGGDPNARSSLVDLALDKERPAIVRATAVELLRGYGPDGATAIAMALSDENPIVRASAIGGLAGLPPEPRVDTLAKALEDPVRAVRIEAARVLASTPAENWKPDQRAKFQAALAEFREAQEFAADVPSGQMNLGRLEADLGNVDKAAEHFRTAIRMDEKFAPAPLELARVFNEVGRNEEAETLLREALQQTPEEAEIHYSLGLLLAEMGRLDEAERALGQAVKFAPDRVRIRYNHALALQQLGRRADAEKAFLGALDVEPSNPDVVNALMILYVQDRRLERALVFAERLAALVPGPGPQQMVEQIRGELAAAAGR